MVTNLISVKAIRAIIDKEDPAVKEQLEVIITKAMAEKESRRRQPRPPAPEGGISINAASKKYKIAKTTLYQWVKKKYIPVIKSTKYETFITESCVAKIAEVYKPRRGSWDVKKLFEDLN